MTAARLPRIYYVTSQYPEFHETFVAREIEALRLSGTEVTIFSLKPPPPPGDDLYPAHRQCLVAAPLIDLAIIGSFLKNLASRPVKFARALGTIVSTYWKRPVELAKALAVFPKAVYFADRIRSAPGAVHAHWATIPATIAMAIRELTNCPFSITAHAWDIYLSPRSELVRKISHANGVATCTAFNVDYLKNLDAVDAGKIRLNYHGLDFGIIDNALVIDGAADSLKLICVGRLVEQKGFRFLLEALADPKLEGRAITLTIIGDGPLEGGFRALAAKLPESIRVDFAGRKSYAETLGTMKGSDVLVAPSVVEKDGNRDGIPNVILEAMACGLPIIGSSVSGIPEVVISGNTGWLVESESAPAIADAILEATQSTELKLFGDNARRMMQEKFEMHRNCEEFIDLLAEWHAAA